MENELKTKLGLKLFRPFDKKAVTLTEHYDLEKALNIIKNLKEFKKHTRESVQDSYYDIASRFVRYVEENPKGVATVTYKYFSSQTIAGRMEADIDVDKEMVMQRMVREIRDSIASKHYMDVDMSNAQPKLLQWLCNKFKCPCPTLDKYIESRDDIIDNIAEKNGKDSIDIKLTFIHVMNGGKEMYDELQEKTQYLEDFYKEMWDIRLFMMREFPKTFERAKKHKNTTSYPGNYTGSLINILLTTLENHCLQCMIYFFKENGFVDTDCVMLYDGIYIPRNPELHKYLKKCEKFVEDQLNIKIVLKIKDFDVIDI